MLNFGLSAPIDVQIQDVNFDARPSSAGKLLARMKRMPGVADAHLMQVLNYPALQVDVDRLRAAQLNISQRDVANNMLTSLSSSVAGRAELLPQSAEQRELLVAVQTPIEQINRSAICSTRRSTVRPRLARAVPPRSRPRR